MVVLSPTQVLQAAEVMEGHISVVGQGHPIAVFVSPAPLVVPVLVAQP